MSSATSDTTAVAVGLVLHGPTLAVPSLDELERLAAVPERRVVIKGVDWTFYERLVDSIPKACGSASITMGRIWSSCRSAPFTTG